MHRICLRTKIEAIVGALLLIVIAVASLTSVSRTINDIPDEINSLIRNSNENYWVASAENLQKAIWDLNESGWYNNKGGTVYMPGNTTIKLTKPLIISSPDGIMSRNNIIIQGDGKSTVLQGDDSFNIIEISDLRYSTLRDFTVKDGLNGIYFYDGDTSIGSADHCIIENIYVIDCVNDGFHVYRAFSMSFISCKAWDNGRDGLWINTNGGGGYNINGGSYGFELGHGNGGCGINITGVGATGVDISGVCAENNGQDGISVFATGCTAITGCYTEGNDRYSYRLGGLYWGDKPRSQGISLENCYAKDKRIYIDAPYCSVEQCWIRGDDDTHSIEATKNAIGLIIEPGRYDKTIYIDSNSTSYFISNDFSILDGSLNELFGIESTGEIRSKIYSQTDSPDIADNSFAFWYNISNNLSYIVLDVDGIQYYSKMSKIF